MTVEDSGLEVLRKAAEVMDAANYRIRTTARLSGLSVGGLVTEVTLNSTTWTALPITPLSGRNAIAIQNKSGTEIKINYSSSVVGYVGMVISNGSERYYDITEDIIIYGKSLSDNPVINVEELA